MKLEEFRLETYEERSVLQYALVILRARDPAVYKLYQQSVDTLLTRLSSTQCREGGCSFCGDEYDPNWDE